MIVSNEEAARAGCIAWVRTLLGSVLRPDDVDPTALQGMRAALDAAIPLLTDAGQPLGTTVTDDDARTALGIYFGDDQAAWDGTSDREAVAAMRRAIEGILPRLTDVGVPLADTPHAPARPFPTPCHVRFKLEDGPLNDTCTRCTHLVAEHDQIEGCRTCAHAVRNWTPAPTVAEARTEGYRAGYRDAEGRERVDRLADQQGLTEQLRQIRIGLQEVSDRVEQGRLDHRNDIHRVGVMVEHLDQPSPLAELVSERVEDEGALWIAALTLATTSMPAYSDPAELLARARWFHNEAIPAGPFDQAEGPPTLAEHDPAPGRCGIAACPACRAEAARANTVPGPVLPDVGPRPHVFVAKLGTSNVCDLDGCGLRLMDDVHKVPGNGGRAIPKGFQTPMNDLPTGC